MKNYKYILLLLIIICLTGCESTVSNVDLPTTEPKLVIYSFISPADSLLKVTVKLARPNFQELEKGSDLVTNAEVSIAQDTRSVVLGFNPLTQQYEADTSLLPVLPGKTYHLKVSTPDGKKAEAFCTVPAVTNESLEVRLDSAKHNKPYTPGDYTLDVSWQHSPGAEFYRLEPSLLLYGRHYTDSEFAYSARRVYFEENKWFFTKDEHRNGEFALSNGSFYKEKFQLSIDGREYGYKLIRLDVYLLTTDQHYYNYHTNARYFGQDPFREPERMYTNINGGLGIFCAYNQQLKQIFF